MTWDVSDEGRQFPTVAGLSPSTATVTDLELVERARRQDEGAWAELVHRHHVAVYRLAFSALLREDEADEAAQEAWVAAWLRLEGFRGEASFRTWLLAIAWRKALDRRRVFVRWLQRVGKSPRHEGGETHMDQLTDVTACSAEHQLLSRESRGHVARAMRGLPRAHRDCLMLAATGELTYEEIAALLGMPLGSVKWRVSEARKRLRTRLEGLGR